jgi:6-phosphogluconolactonase
MKLPNALSVIAHDSLDGLNEAVAQRIAVEAQGAIAARGAFHIALAGGDTPRRCYERLRDLPIEWSKVQVYFGDERCLPRGDVQRNDSMACEALLKHVAIPSGNVHAIPAEHGAKAAAAEYAAVLKQSLRHGGAEPIGAGGAARQLLPQSADSVITSDLASVVGSPSRMASSSISNVSQLPLDLVLLGMGEDGHTASLFPDNPATENVAPVVAVFDAPKPPPERVSLSIATLNAARVKVFLVAGAGKREALQRIAQGGQLPAGRIMGAEWHVDRAAWPD